MLYIVILLGQHHQPRPKNSQPAHLLYRALFCSDNTTSPDLKTADLQTTCCTERYSARTTPLSLTSLQPTCKQHDVQSAILLGQHHQPRSQNSHLQTTCCTERYSARTTPLSLTSLQPTCKQHDVQSAILLYVMVVFMLWIVSFVCIFLTNM